ncbi:MAG: CapA family protein [Bacillota bacterium]|jgi:poly-gamma-glutamate synthesis protein (capsule biosynthesis protein)|nr:CapA family protein [Bacillota bacterium]HHT90120.1 CapA family protein [Bacillota bacterium]
MFVVVLKGRRLILHLITLFWALGLLFSLWSWLTRPYRPPLIGLDGQSTALLEQLFQGEQIGAIRLGPQSDLLVWLQKGELDYIIELDAPTAHLMSWHLGELLPAVVVPYFDRRMEMDLGKLQALLADEPHQVLIADSLALPGFPWSPRSVRYLPSEKVVEALREGQGKIGIIPWQDRLPGVRVLPFSATDDPESNPLRRSLFLSRSPKNVLARLRDRFTQHQDLQGDTAYLREQQVTLLAVGDIMLDRDVKKEGLQKGWTHIFSEVAPRIRQADLSFANLESPIGDKGHFINMFQAPPQAIEGVASAGFDVVSLANNHTLDYHHEGMFETMRLLDQVGIDWVGAGENIQEARRPLITEVSGIRVGFLAYTEMWFVHAREPISWQATLDEPGVAPAELDLVVEDVKKLRDQVDCVIVTVHWGKEYVHEPTPEQRSLARAAVDAGADLVLGHHPHVLQGIEFYKQGVIVYSLGNFVFDLNRPKTWETMMLEFTLSPRGPLDMTIIPAYIFGIQPRILTGSHREAVYDQIRSYSLPFD